MARESEGRALRGATFNLDNNRDDAKVRGEVDGLIRGERLDFLAYQEGQEYADNLARIPGTDLHTTRGMGPSRRDAGIVTRSGVPAKGYKQSRTRQTWQRDKGPGQHWARSFPHVQVDWLRVVSVHMPRQHHTLAYASCWAALLIIAIRHPRVPLVLVGDWNKGRHRKGQWTPRLLAAVIGGRIYGDGIDYVIARGCTVTGLKRVDHGASDHKPVVFTVERS